ncbi:hypothetical protein BMF94_5949 [Rhodotorula taiwanensis]|uniref:ATP-dependent DNA helicase n=1 Tax=Rhodotorula taiwanensis TaxID=741276 RepID=A0A2S5B2L8_9BASI|nr:hypothetical protein BMF94_5949 [Rhodotorula taiwanensis]
MTTDADQHQNGPPSSLTALGQQLHSLACRDDKISPVPESAPSSPVKPQQVQAVAISPPGYSQLPSATQKRTKAEIERKRDEALERRRQKEKDKSAADRQKKREELAAQSLSKFGFTIASAGISRYGTGRGGFDVKDEPVLAKEEKPKIWEPDTRCSDEQKAVLEEVKAGRLVFFTGAAGVGKSFLLQEITRLLEYLQRPFQITATTGIAALQVSGITVHSWSGVGLGKDPVTVLYDRIMRSKERVKIWTTTEVLVIDEISMIGADLFTKLDVLGKLIRRDRRPFGGIQLVVSGDFFQLPPVPEPRNELRCMRCGHHNLQKVALHDACLPYEERAKGVPPDEVLRCTDIVKRNGEKISGCGSEWRTRRFAFETEAWAECAFKVMELTKVYRQDHPAFIATLAKIRRGICDDECTAFLKTCGTELGKGGNIKIQPTNLYPIRSAVENENRREFEKLREEAYTFQALDDSRGGYARTVMAERLANVPPAKSLALKKGAQVLLLANLNIKQGLVNGSRGVIVDWVDRDLVPLDDKLDSTQAGTTQKRKVAGGAFGGEEWREKAAEEWADKQDAEVFPLVYFATGAQVIIRPHSWCIDIDKENTVARTQLPLQLAWALTIHKSQGQSLDAVGVRLNATFEKGQAYVALSRCRKPEGMKIEGFHPGVVMAHPTVSIFYDCIKEGRPFFVTPFTYLNPLSFVQDFDPLLLSLTPVFGKPPAAPPAGSAILAPGQKPPVGVKAPPAVLEAAAASTLNGALTSLAEDSTTWENLLERAAERFLASRERREGAGALPAPLDQHGQPLDETSIFTAQAFRTVTSLIGKRKAADDEVDSSRSPTPPPGGPGGVGTEERDSQTLDCKPKKPKRKRSKRRVGH